MDGRWFYTIRGKFMIKQVMAFCLVLTAVLMVNQDEGFARDLVACIGIIPPHSMMGKDGVPTGGFVDVVRAIDDVYKEGRITIQLYPIARAINMVKSGKADLFIPYIPPPHLEKAELDYTFASEPLVQVAFVLYSRADGPEFPMDHLGVYKIETLRGAAEHFPFPIGEIDSFRQGLLKVISSRSDGFIVEQEAADKYIREHKLKNIRRTLYAVWNSSIVIPKGERGKELDLIISTALGQLKQSGTLQKITQTIHKPYEDWQPYLMDW